MSSAHRVDKDIYLGDAVPDVPDATVAVRLVLPPAGKLAASPRAFFCAPGGGMSKEYFDLGDDTDRRWSFAEAMACAGHITVAIDPLGGGASAPVPDGYLLTPEAMAAAYAVAVRAVRAELAVGLDGYPPLPELLSIGAGHSMGGMVVTWAQAHCGLHDGLLVMGSGPYGLTEDLMEPLRPLAGDPHRARAEIVDSMRAAGLPPYMELRSSDRSRSIFRGGEAAGLVWLRPARIPLAMVPGSFVMIPESWAPEAAVIDKPVLLLFGDEDIGPEPRQVPAWFKASPDITVTVMPGTGHSHFVFPSFPLLTRRVLAWAAALCGPRSGDASAPIEEELLNA